MYVFITYNQASKQGLFNVVEDPLICRQKVFTFGFSPSAILDQWRHVWSYLLTFQGT